MSSLSPSLSVDSVILKGRTGDFLSAYATSNAFPASPFPISFPQPSTQIFPTLVTNNLDPGWEKIKLESCANTASTRDIGHMKRKAIAPPLTPYFARFYRNPFPLKILAGSVEICHT